MDNADPLNLNRVKLKVPQVLYTNITNWASPCLPVVSNSPALLEPILETAASVSLDVVPQLNQGVWVMFEGGDPNFPVWMGVY